MSSLADLAPTSPRDGAGQAMTCDVQASLDAVRHAATIVAALRRADDLVTTASDDAQPADVVTASLDELRQAAHDPADEVTAISAVHALGALPASAGQEALRALLGCDRPHLREHAAWALADTRPCGDAVGPLVAMVASGGFAGMLAQRTLETWAARIADAVRARLLATLANAALGQAALGQAALAGDDHTSTLLGSATDADARARLVETLGLVPGRDTVAALLTIAQHPTEPPRVRAAAVAALGEHPHADSPAVMQALDTLAAGEGALADTAGTALHDLGFALPPRSPGGTNGIGPDPASPALLQLFLHADIDATLSHAGQGDTGGIATLLVQLGDALVSGDGATARAITVSRGRPAHALTGLDALASPGHHFATVPLWGPPVAAAQAWPLRVAVRRGIRRILRAARPDVVHLRMADVGSMAAAEAAREAGVPVVLTLAPDPHTLMNGREAAGTLRRDGFGAVDHAEHLVFRDRLLRSLADEAAHLVVFPRPDLRRDLRELLGVDVTEPSVRVSVIGEGIDLAGIGRAVRAVADADHAAPPALCDLDTLLAALPPERRALPLALSVGRLHRVKGMATLVETWASRADLHHRCNLLVVGGDLEDPTRDEAAELDRIHAAVPETDAARRGLLLAGHRPNAVVAVWLAAARQGRPGLAAPHGVYVCASLKEEFGIAILEAMSAGLVVVAPDGGGPPTYVDGDVTGVLVDTTDDDALAGAVSRALSLSQDPDAVARADATRALVRERFGIETMARALDEVYARVAVAAADPRRDGPTTPAHTTPALATPAHTTPPLADAVPADGHRS